MSDHKVGRAKRKTYQIIPAYTFSKNILENMLVVVKIDNCISSKIRLIGRNYTKAVPAPFKCGNS